MEKVSTAKDLQESLKRFYQLVDTNKDVIGKNVAIFPDARRKVALIESEAGKLARKAAKAVENGQLSDQDAAAYEVLYPSKWDSWDYAQQVLIKRMEDLEDSAPRFITGVRQAGFYVPQSFELEDNITGLWRERYNMSGGN
jgi:chemotaxis regulatin CheY-phosphate phosphatase CheZ